MMADTLPRVSGKLTKGAPLAPLVWFKSGGAAEWLFEPADVADLAEFLRDLDPAVPVMALGLGSASSSSGIGTCSLGTLWRLGVDMTNLLRIFFWL